MPTGVAARCFISTIVPTVPDPAGGAMVRLIPAAGAFVGSLDSMVNIAFPAIAAAFDAPPEQVRWVIICYTGSYAVMSFIAGTAADRIGHLPVFRSGLVLSVAGFALCGLAPTFGFLLAGRAVQGIAGGLVYGTAPALATLGAAPSLRGRRLGSLNAAIGLGFASGPAVAGVLIGALGWRAVFYARVPLALAALCWALLARGSRGGEPRRLEPSGREHSACHGRPRPLRRRVRARRLPGAEHGGRDGRVPGGPPGSGRRAHVPRADAWLGHRRRGPRGRLRPAPRRRGGRARFRRGVRARGSCRRGGGARRSGREALYSRAMMTLRVSQPFGTTAVEVRPLAPRRPSLRGLRVAILDNSKPNADVLLGRVAELLVERAGAGPVA